MTNKDKKRVVDWVTKWKCELLLSHWSINLEFQERDLEDDRLTVHASCTSTPQYHTARLKIYPAFFAQCEEDQEQTIVHELCHTLTAPLAEIIDALQGGKIVTPSTVEYVNEAVVDMFSRIVLIRNRE